MNLSTLINAFETMLVGFIQGRTATETILMLVISGLCVFMHAVYKFFLDHEAMLIAKIEKLSADKDKLMERAIELGQKKD